MSDTSLEREAYERQRDIDKTASLPRAEQFAKLLQECIEFCGLSDKMRITDVHPGHIGVCNVGATPQDSWQINLLAGAVADEDMAHLEGVGFVKNDDCIAYVRYAFEGDFSIMQCQIPCPGQNWPTSEVRNFRKEDAAGALAHVMRILAHFNFDTKTATPIPGRPAIASYSSPVDEEFGQEPPLNSRFQKHWFDFLVIPEKIRQQQRTGDSMAVLSYGDQKILFPLTDRARHEMQRYLPNNLPRKFGGYILPFANWRDYVHILWSEKCYGTVLYLDRIYN